MPLAEYMKSEVPKYDANIFFIIENSNNVSSEALNAINHSFEELQKTMSEMETTTDMQVKAIILEFDDKCRIITEDGPVHISEISSIEIRHSDMEPDFEKMLFTLNGVIKDYCNRNFIKRSFYAPVFIFITAGPKDTKYVNALNSLKRSRLYNLGVRIALQVDKRNNIERIADIVGSEEAVLSMSNLDLFTRLFRFQWVEVEPLLD
mgnify:FL=1